MATETHWTEHEDGCPCVDCADVRQTAAEYEAMGVTPEDLPTLVGLRMSARTGDQSIVDAAVNVAKAIVEASTHPDGCRCELCALFEGDGAA